MSAERAVALPVDNRPGVPKSDPILVADSVRRAFGGLVAVDVDHAEVQRGEITALIGPNGAGKTTFFNLMTGFDEPDQGQWTFDGTSIEGMQPYKVARLGMVRTFQLTKVLARLTVIENMRLGATGQPGERLWTRRPGSSPGAARSATSPSGPTPCWSGSRSPTCATSSPETCRAVSESCSRCRER